MIRRITGILILLSFLMIKHAPAYISDIQKSLVTLSDTEENKELPEERKGPVGVEFADEEAIVDYFAGLHEPLCSWKYILSDSPETETVYLSVLNPPPDQALS